MQQPDRSNPPQRRRTRQLAAVYEAIVAEASHPSAEAVFLRVRRALPQISLGTVYRNLQRLTEEGKVRVLLSGKRTTRYDAVTVEHDHFICQQCGHVLDLCLQQDRHVDVASLEAQGLLVTRQSVLLHGLCQPCGTKHKSSAEKATPRGRKLRDVL